MAKVHRGLRWICPICKDQQVSKHSHIRHYNAMHQDKTPLNPDENMRYMGVFVDLPEIAKDAIIQSLKEKNQVFEVLAKDFRKRLLQKLKENINLKAQLGLNAELEQLEYNNLIGGEKDEESEHSVENSVEKILELQSPTSDDDEQNSLNFTHYPDNMLKKIHWST